jgi:dienelactone hydrolase
MHLALLLLPACGPNRPACGITWVTDAADPSQPLSLERSRFADRAGPSRLLGTRVVRLVAPEDAAAGTVVTVSAELPGIVALDASGAELAFPLDLKVADLPLVLHLEGASGQGSLSAAAQGCDARTLALRVVEPPLLTGRSRSEAPGFGHDDLFVDGEEVEIALDPGIAPDGLSATAWWVPHRTLDGWAEAPTLDGESASVAWRGERLADASHPLVVAATGAGTLGSTWDVVLDVDGDGAFSPGDRLDQGRKGEGIRVVGDLGTAGPHPVSQADVVGGDWLGERLYWPTDLAELGPRPLVVISHGNGHAYDWYDYLGQHFASWGFVVMSHENETEPGIETAATTTLTNTDWLLTNVDTVADGALAGLVDATRIGWIGHSRGGEGIVQAYARLVEGDFPSMEFGAEDVRVLASIAPTVFYEVNVSDPSGVRYHLLAGSSDGDVTGSPASPPTQSFRLLQAATRTRSSTYIYGASHEDFNCCGYDDGRGPDQLEREDVQAIAKAYLLAVMAESLDDDPYAAAILARDPMRQPATPFDATVLSTWHGEDAVVVDDFQFSSDLGTASSQAEVVANVTDPTEGKLDDGDGTLTWTAEDPMNGMTQASERTDDAAGVVFGWTSPARFGYRLPERDADWSGATAFSFAACQATRDPNTVALDDDLDLSVTLVDGAGTAVTRSIRPYAVIAAPYQRMFDGDGKGWSNAFTTVRMPLVDFTSDGTGLDLADVREVHLELGGEGQSPLGRIGLDDVEVVP